MFARWLVTAMLLATSALAQWQQVEVVLRDQDDLRDLGTALGGVDVCGLVHTERGVSLPLSARQVELLRDTGFDFAVQIADLEALFAERLSTREYGAYHTPDEAYATIDSLEALHPNIIGPRVSIGTSLEGRDIWAIRVSDNPTLDEGEPAALINSYIHAREAITLEVVLHFLEYLIDGYGIDSRVTRLVDEREIWFVPVVNPDGVAYNIQTNPNGGGMWRKNRRNNGDGNFGVDLNRNFGYGWGWDDEGSSPYTWSTTYRGSGPFSEPETQVYRDFINSRNIRASLTYHSYSNLVIYPWDYVDVHTPDHATFNRVSALMTEENGYYCGTAYDAVGYLTNGGTEDWLYGDTLEHDPVLCFTVEVGSYSDNFWPSESRIEPLCEENMELLMRFLEAGRDFYGTWPPATPCITSGLPDNHRYTLSWETPDPMPQNEAVSYDLCRVSGYQDTGADAMNNTDRWSGSWRLSSVSSYSAPTCLHSYPEDRNQDNEWIMQLSADVEVALGQLVECQMKSSLTLYHEYLYLEVSTDGCEWTPVDGDHTTALDPYGISDGPAITGYMNDWTLVSWSLADYVGECVYLRLRQTAPEGTPSEGVYIDDFSPAPVWMNIEETLADIADTSALVSQYGEDTGWMVRAQDADEQTSCWSVVARPGNDPWMQSPAMSIEYRSASSSFLISWVAVATAVEYRVEKATSMQGPWEELLVTSGLSCSEQRDTSQQGFYRVTAIGVE